MGLEQTMKISQLDLQNLESAFAFNNGVIEVGISESYLAKNINLVFCKYEGRTRDTNLEKIDVDDLEFSFSGSGFIVEGNVNLLSNLTPLKVIPLRAT